jgi:citrate/tricarballylate utilization protein
MQTTEAIEDARRAMHICNACRYCEGFCAVFPAMELRRTFTNADLAYLANLCPKLQWLLLLLSIC